MFKRPGFCPDAFLYTYLAHISCRGSARASSKNFRKCISLVAIFIIFAL